MTSLRIITHIRSWFAWRYIGERGAWGYFENSITGRRKAEKRYMGHSPQFRSWLDGGPWDKPDDEPTFGGPYGIEPGSDAAELRRQMVAMGCGTEICSHCGKSKYDGLGNGGPR